MGKNLGSWSWRMLISCLVPFLCLTGCDDPGALTPQEAKEHLQKVKGVRVVDVRTEGEFRQGHLPDAVNVPLNEFDKFLTRYEKEEPVLFYCRSGNRSGTALYQAKQRGYQQVFHIKGGISAWEDAGFPVVR